MYYVHDVFHGANGVFIAQKMWKYLFIIIKYQIYKNYRIYYYHICNHENYPAILHGKNFLSVLYIYCCNLAMLIGIRWIFQFFFYYNYSYVKTNFTYCVLCCERNFEVIILEKFNNEFCFFTSICKFRPLRLQWFFSAI